VQSTLIPPRMVALCTESGAFSENQILRREIAEKYPGALWLPELADKLLRRGIFMVTGDVALRQVLEGIVLPKDIWVIEEDRSSVAEELIRLGATAKVLLCFESPLFAASFYQSLLRISQDFDHCVVFRGAVKDAVSKISTHALYFPSFTGSHFCEGLPWSARKYMVMVAANKYWKIRRSPIRQIVAKIRDFVYRRPVRFSQKHAFFQLHDKRLAVISHFGRLGKLDLFGGGWGDLSNLPLKWQSELLDTVSSLNPQPCVDKQATMANYKFALCFENIEFPGYVTEKVIDCLVSGVVPIYLGAPDIRDFIPEGCFIDARKFSSLYELEDYLKKISEMEWTEIVKCGGAFLKSKAGQRYSITEFAARIEAMLIG